MSRYRFRAHRQAGHAINLMRQDAYKNAKAAQERNSAEAQAANEVNKKKKEVNELSHKTYQGYIDKATSYPEQQDVESEAEAANSRRKTTWKKAFARKLSRASGVKTATKKLKEEEVNEVFPPAVGGALKAASDKYRKIKQAEKDEKEKKEVKEERFVLPEKYGGDHSVRNIYMDEARANRPVSSGRSAGGAAHDTSYGGGLYGSVADSPARAAPAARPAARPAAPAVHGGAQAPAPAAKPAAQAPAPVRNPARVAPTTTGTNTVPAPNAPKAPAGDVPGQGTSVSDRFTYAKTDGGGGVKPAAPSPGIQPGQGERDKWGGGPPRPEIKAAVPAAKGASGADRATVLYPPAPGSATAQAVHGLTTAPKQAVQDISAPTSSLLGKSPEKTVSPIAKPGTSLPQTPPPSTPSGGSSIQPKTLGPTSSTEPTKSDVGPSSSLSATSPELKSILSKDAGPGQSSLTPGLKTTPTPLAAQRQTIRKKVQDIAGPTFENKIPLPDKYGGEHSVRKIYRED